MTRRPTSPGLRVWQAAGTCLVALPALGLGVYGLGRLLLAGLAAVGAR